MTCVRVFVQAGLCISEGRTRPRLRLRLRVCSEGLHVGKVSSDLRFRPSSSRYGAYFCFGAPDALGAQMDRFWAQWTAFWGQRGLNRAESGPKHWPIVFFHQQRQRDLAQRPTQAPGTHFWRFWAVFFGDFYQGPRPHPNPEDCKLLGNLAATTHWGRTKKVAHPRPGSNEPPPTPKHTGGSHFRPLGPCRASCCLLLARLLACCLLDARAPPRVLRT